MNQVQTMKPAKLLITVIFLIFFRLTSIGQINLPEPGILYSMETVPRIDIHINPDTLDHIFENPHSDREYRALFVFKNQSVTDSIREIGFRLRGNTSRDSWKKSFKVSFNTFHSGRKYKGVEKMNLNGEHNDPSSSRALIYWYILRKAGIPGPRANHVSLYVNGMYYGLYTNVEHIDEEFAETYFGNKKGNLYKCTWPSDLTYMGSNQNAYKFQNGGKRAYELKTNEEADDYSDLVNFISILNNSSNTELPCKLEGIFNVQGFLKVAAIDVLTGNWDGYSFNKNNFYLYHNPETGLFEYIPYDVDNTFGIDWFNINWSTRNIYNWASSEPRPLFKRLMAIQDYKTQFTYYVRQIIDIMNEQGFNHLIDDLRIQARPYIPEDPFYPLDYGYNLQSFDKSWNSGTGDHVPLGIVEFINNRINSALGQAVTINAPPMISRINNTKPSAKEHITISALIEDEGVTSAKLVYRINQSEWQYTDMKDDGLNNDLTSNDNIYTVGLEGFPANTQFEYYLEVIDINSREEIKPCIPNQYIFPGNGKQSSIVVWPNPAYGNNVYISEPTSFKIYDLTGRILLEGNDANWIDITSLKGGLCILKTQDGSVIKLMVIK